MRTVVTYSFSQLEPYINWVYFYHAWSLNGKPESERQRMKAEALDTLCQTEDRFKARAIIGLYPAWGDGDDIVLDGGERIPLLRQQHPAKGCDYTLCLSDFVRPAGYGEPDRIGVFATTVDSGMKTDCHGDTYQQMLRQTLADRLAEAAAERLHYEVRTRLWGYQPDEPEDPARMLACDYQGIRPAIGYPSMPDTSLNFVLDRLLHFTDIGIRLTESGMMTPHASVSGLMISHPEARYFDLGKIGDDQLTDYAHRRGIPITLMRKFLESNMIRQ